jgi:hypothetical protein
VEAAAVVVSYQLLLSVVEIGAAKKIAIRVEMRKVKVVANPMAKLEEVVCVPALRTGTSAPI